MHDPPAQPPSAGITGVHHQAHAQADRRTPSFEFEATLSFVPTF
jgi:hypothetical protein